MSDCKESCFLCFKGPKSVCFMRLWLYRWMFERNIYHEKRLGSRSMKTKQFQTHQQVNFELTTIDSKWQRCSLRSCKIQVMSCNIFQYQDETFWVNAKDLMTTSARFFLQHKWKPQSILVFCMKIKHLAPWMYWEQHLKFGQLPSWNYWQTSVCYPACLVIRYHFIVTLEHAHEKDTRPRTMASKPSFIKSCLALPWQDYFLVSYLSWNSGLSEITSTLWSCLLSKQNTLSFESVIFN